MIRKISKVISLLIVIGCLGFTVPAWGAEQSVMKPGSITYEMQDIRPSMRPNYGLSGSNGWEKYVASLSTTRFTATRLSLCKCCTVWSS